MSALESRPDLPEQVKILRPQWADMLQRMVLVELHIRRWRARTNLVLGDLGLELSEDDAAWRQLVRLGDKLMLPSIPEDSEFYDKKAPKRTYVALLETRESNCRAWLRTKTVALYWGHALMLTKFDEVNDALEAYRAEYYRVRDELCKDNARWRAHIARLEEEYRKFAYESADRLQTLSNGNGRVATLDRADFADRFWKQLSGLIPSAAQFYDSFSFEIQYGFVNPLAWMDAGQRDAMLLEMKRDPVGAAQAEAYQKAFALYQRQAAQLMDESLAVLSANIANLTYDACLDILESMKKNGGTLIGKASQRVMSLLRILRENAITSETDAAKMAAKVRDLVELGPDATRADIENLMRQIATVTRDTLLQLNEQPRSARELGVPDVLEAETVNRARRELGLAVAESASLVRRSRKLELAA